MKNNSFKFLVYIVFILNCINIYAAGPEWVYRVDTRPPEQIFENGFTAWGMNDNVESHIAGASIRDHTTAFIPTTGTEARNIHTLSILFQNNQAYQSSTLWLYRIRPTESFFSFNRSMERTMRNGATTAIRENAEDLHTIYAGQDEWGALYRIEANQIDQAVPYTWDPRGQDPYQRVVAGQTQINPNYHAAQPNANTGYYPFLGNGRNQSLVNRILTIGHTLLLYATCPGGSRGNSQVIVLTNSENYSCDHPLSVSYEQFVDFLKYWQISHTDNIYYIPSL